MNQALLDEEFSREIEAILAEQQDANLGGLFKKFRKALKRVKKIVKKVAPVVAAGAAMYYGAPYAIAAAKSAGNWVSSKYAAATAPQVTGEMGPPAPATSMMSPQVISLATNLAKRQLRSQGVNVKSPRANAAIDRYMEGTMQNMQQRVVPSPATDYKKFIIPAIAAGGAVLLLKG